MVLNLMERHVVEQPGANRRLCALVAVEMAGGSRQAGADAELSRLVFEAAGVLGGRVFDAAGGFMLEFPSVANALTAAEAIMAGTPAPVRMALHLGEATATEEGAVVGRGADLAARLQQAADAGEILVSGDARRALGRPMAERLQPVGRVRTARMKEETVVYSLKVSGSSSPRSRVKPPRALVLVGLALLALIGVLAWRLAPAPVVGDPLTVAVRTFQSDGGAGSGPTFGVQIADRLTSAFVDRRAPTVSRVLTREGRLGSARLVLGGAVQRTGPVLRVKVQMEDAKSRLVLWSAAFQRPASESLALQTQVATEVADIIMDLRDELGPDAKGVQSEVLAAQMKAVGLRRSGKFKEAREAYRRLASLAPQSSRVHSSLAAATSLALAETKGPPELAALWRAEIMDEARRALEIDPRNGAAYLALASVTPASDHLEREAMIAKAKAAEPGSWRAMAAEGEHLRNTGRLQASLAAYQQALARDPYRPGVLAGVILGLAGLDRYEEAESVGARAARLLPDDDRVRRANLVTALLFASPDKAAAAIDRFQQREPRLDPAEEKAWRDFVAARGGKMSADRAARALTVAARTQAGVDPGWATAAFALLGKLDEAFAEAERARDQEPEVQGSSLFEPPTSAMRLDARFFPLMERLGLLAYWRRTGRWPDFCQGATRPYDCEARARAALPQVSPP